MHFILLFTHRITPKCTVPKLIFSPQVPLSSHGVRCHLEQLWLMQKCTCDFQVSVGLMARMQPLWNKGNKKKTSCLATSARRHRGNLWPLLSSWSLKDPWRPGISSGGNFESKNWERVGEKKKEEYWCESLLLRLIPYKTNKFFMWILWAVTGGNHSWGEAVYCLTNIQGRK